MVWARGVVEQAQSIIFTKARLVRRNLCGRSRESVVGIAGSSVKKQSEGGGSSDGCGRSACSGPGA